MSPQDDEEERIRSVAIQNAQAILLARQRAEQELLHAKEALEARTAELERVLTDLKFQNELNRTIAENAASGLLMLNHAGVATYVNPAALEVTGYTLDDFANVPFHEVLHAGEGHSGRECPITLAVERRVPLKNQRDTFRHQDGSLFPISCSVSPLQPDAGGGAVLEFRDTTDEMLVQKALEDTNRRKDEFLATLSHELRTPMTAVLGWVQMLKMGLGETETRDAINAIEKSAEIQAQLIDDVLDVSRITAGKMTFQPRPVDVGPVLRAAMTTIHPAASAKNIEVLSSIPPNLPSVAGDEGRLQQIFWNLLANAVKFTARGGTITVKLAHVGSVVRFTVQDNGKGIDPAFLPHVFELFTQEDGSTTRSHEGVGLGLSIVRSLVELHGGRVRVASEGVGRGAKFTVEIPVIELPATTARSTPKMQATTVEKEGVSSSRLNGVKVLVIDDQEFTRDLVGAILRRADAEIQNAGSVQEGLRRFQNMSADVVVCDIAMPQEDGFAFVKAIRSLPGPSNKTPIIALTAFGRPEDRRYALSAGFDAFLRKPVDVEELTETVLRLSEHR